MKSPKQENFINHILNIPIEEKGWKDLVAFDNLHAFCGELEPSDEARLEILSKNRKSSLHWLVL